ncbi:MAG: response regulator [Deltaproteobacteria bacterium]|nr:response regulator [Deltaproteobacteria bacterium]
MMDDTEKINLGKLQNMFARQLPQKIAAIKLELERLQQKICPAKEWEPLFLMFHTLAGSAPAFGYTQVGEHAREAEIMVKQIISETDALGGGALPRIKQCLEGMITGSASTAEQPQQHQDKMENLSLIFNRECSPPKGKTVFIVDDDPLLLERLAIQVRCFGYEVRTFISIAALRAVIEESRPSVIIMDMIFPDSELAGAHAITELKKLTTERIPVIFLSIRSSLAARIEAVKAGGDAYLVKPPAVGALIDKLDELTAVKVVEPYHILIVDDDPELSKYYALILEQEGMITKIVNDQSQILECLAGFRPDLILMDIYMPEYHGYDLAKVIRQMDAYVSIPIVFLSRETDLDKQLMAMRTGGDDFLTKPISPERLIASVAIRAERMRVIRNFMERDSLTDLLNHSKIEEQLERMVHLAGRGGRPLTCAMIDIDNFKAVNDTFGHQEGDQVLVILSRLLQQRLRMTDIAGRYGGEEFLVILPDTDGPNAVNVLNELRESFGQIRHDSEHGEFRVTFSCGVATFPEYATISVLINAADKALYEAKKNGRDQVILASRKKGEMENPKHILVVDDDSFVNEMLAMILTEDEFFVTTAQNGREALEKLTAEPSIGLMITDLNMPEMGGLELLDRVRSSGLTFPVIVLSAEKESETASMALRLGATAILEKNENIQENVLKLVRQVLSHT